MGRSRVVLIVLVVFAWLGAHATLRADEGRGQGQDLLVTVSSESFQLSDGRTVQRTENTGFVQGDHPFVGNHTCFGTSVIAADGAVSATGYCDAYDADEDVYFWWWRGDAQGGTWGFLGGTGKFEGIEGGGTWKAGTTFPDGKSVNTWEGSWNMQ